MADNTMAASSTVLVIGPAWSNESDRGMTPCLLTSPYVGFKPTVPHNADGMRIEPPVSVPIVAAQDQPIDRPTTTSVSQPRRWQVVRDCSLGSRRTNSEIGSNGSTRASRGTSGDSSSVVRAPRWSKVRIVGGNSPSPVHKRSRTHVIRVRCCCDVGGGLGAIITRGPPL